MPFSLEKKLKGKESNVLEEVRLLGVDQAMIVHKVKSRQAFMRWVRAHTGDGLYPNALAGMKGGEKAMWMRGHRKTILDCLEIFGRDFTMENFHLKPDTLEGFVRSNNEPISIKMSNTQRAQLTANTALGTAEEALRKIDLLEIRDQMLQARQEETQGMVRELKDLFGQFVNSTSEQISKALITPLLEHIVSFSGSLPESNPLNTDGLIAQAEKLLKEKNQHG